MQTGSGRIRDIVVVRCELGEDLLECIKKAIADHHIKNGVIVTGYGTLDQSRVHMVTSSGFPIEEFIDEKEKPLEVLSIDGVIADGELHAHIVISDVDRAYGGHLEPGCRVLYLAEVVIGILEDIDLKRQTDENGVRYLGINGK